MAINNHHCPPTLPVELNYQILEEAWRLPLSTIERRDLLVALPLVCTSFRWIANRLFLRDAHIVSPAYAVHFLSLLQQQRDRPASTHSNDHDNGPDADADADASLASARFCCCCCKSITFHIYDPDSSPNLLRVRLPSSSNLSTCNALETTLRALSRDAALAPALHRVALHYTGFSFTHELEHPRLAHLPPHVRALELRFVTPPAFAQRLRHIYIRRYVLPMPGVRSLRIYGTCPEFIADVARACPALESLETDDVRGALELQPSLLSFVSSTMAGDGHLVKGPVVSHGTKARSIEWSGNVISAKYETRTQDWKRVIRGGVK